jgi:DNA-binding LacI/PurR family transcriptional regulator
VIEGPITISEVTGHGDLPATRRQTGEVPPRVSIRDVARVAGVSYQTVSRVINEQSGVKDSTRRQILLAIEEMGFRPNRAARALSSGHSRSVTVFTSDTTSYGRAATLQGIEEAARTAGFFVGISVLDCPDPAAIRATVERSCDPGAGGVIVIAFDLTGAYALQAIPAGIPVAAAVEAKDVLGSHSFPSVWLDDRAAAATATRFLLDFGHQTVHYVALPSSTDISARMQGWRDALETAGIRVPEPVPGDGSAESGCRAGRRLAADDRVTAILCANDDMALGVLYAMREAGRPVPGSVSVVGFDDTSLSAFYAPSLTTVRMDFVGVGRECFGLMQDAVDASVSRPRVEPAEPFLVVRASAGPPPTTQCGRRPGSPRT